MDRIALLVLFVIIMVSCSDYKIDQNRFDVNVFEKDTKIEKELSIPIDSTTIKTGPRNVLLTNNREYSLSPIYRVNYNKKTKNPFIGTNIFHTNGFNRAIEGNNWNNNFMPGFEAIYGYNLINISHYKTISKVSNLLFEKPVLIKTLYYPAFTSDTLNFQPVERDFYMISAYTEDSNNVGWINTDDIRKLYYFDLHGLNRKNTHPSKLPRYEFRV